MPHSFTLRMRMHEFFSIISHSRVQGCIHCCNHCALTVKAAPVTKSACQKAFKDHRAATSLGQLPHWCLAAGAGTSQLEPQQPLELLEELLAATQQVKEWLCVSRCNVPHDILLPCHDRNPLLTCFLGLQRHAHSFRSCCCWSYKWYKLFIYANMHLVVLP